MFRKDHYDKKDTFRYHLHLSYLFGFIIFFLLVMLLVILIFKQGCYDGDLSCSKEYSVLRHDITYCDSLIDLNDRLSCYDNFVNLVDVDVSDCNSMFSLDLIGVLPYDVFINLPKVKCYSKLGFSLNEVCDFVFESDLSLKCKYMYG